MLVWTLVCVCLLGPVFLLCGPVDKREICPRGDKAVGLIILQTCVLVKSPKTEYL